jgi:hypothetical protein
MKKIFLLLALTMFFSYGCTAAQTIDTVTYHTEEKGTMVGKVLRLPITAYKSVVRGLKSEREEDNDTLID